MARHTAAETNNAKRPLRSNSSSPLNDLSSQASSVFDISGASSQNASRSQLGAKQMYHAMMDESLLDLGIMSSQQMVNAGLALHVPFSSNTGVHYMGLHQQQEDSSELEDYVQGLNDRFELPTDQILPMTPRCSFDQDSPLVRTDTSPTLLSNFSPPQTQQSTLLPSPATSDITPPQAHVSDIYSASSQQHLQEISIPPPYIQKTPLGPMTYNPQLPVFASYAIPQGPPYHHQHHGGHHVQTASMAEITSSSPPQRFPTPPRSQGTGELLRSPTMLHHPMRHGSPEGYSEGSISVYGGSPHRGGLPFETPPFSPTFASPGVLQQHLLNRTPVKRGHFRGYSTTSLLSHATDHSTPSSDSDSEHTYLPSSSFNSTAPNTPFHHNPAASTASYISTTSLNSSPPTKLRGPRASSIPDSTMQSYISHPRNTGEKYRCLFPDCGKKFGRKYNIQSHIQTHLSDRPYRCEVCRAGFVRQHDLRRHEKIHVGEKPFVCGCKKSFARMDALTRHRQRGICSGAFPDAIEDRKLADSKKARRARRNSIAV